MSIKEKIQAIIQHVLDSQGVPKDMVKINLDHPTDEKFGDYSTNVAMVMAKSLSTTGKNPMALAEKIAEAINADIASSKDSPIEKAEAVAPGFINFFLTPDFFTNSIGEIVEKGDAYGKNTDLFNKKIIIEYTDPNPFKPFHIGHLMSNAIGEALSRILQYQGAVITRATYGGDVGLHVAKTLWGILKTKNDLSESASEREQVDFIGKAYVLGSNAYEEDESAKAEIIEINKKVYSKSDKDINEVYAWGKEVSLKLLQSMYTRLGSHFDYQLFESEVAEGGLKEVKKGLEQGVFEKSQGAVIFPGEKHGLHNRVFITSEELPTYETKELGLTKKKFELGDFDQSIVITASEQNDYYEVILKVLEILFPEIASKTMHFGHGMMRFASGKMSSRKGNVITAETLIDDLKDSVVSKIKDRGFSDTEKETLTEQVALGAIKYSILKQTIGKDIIFDEEKSLSFEGDSGPYLQYTYVRTQSILAKAEAEGIEPGPLKAGKKEKNISTVERTLYKFPEIVERTAADFTPNHIATFLIELSSAFNAYYAHTKVVDPKDSNSPYKVALTQAVSVVLKNGMYLLGIETPKKM